MTLWPSRPGLALSALVIACGTLPVDAAPAMRAGVAARPLVSQGPRAITGQGGLSIHAMGRRGGFRDRGGPFGDIDLDGDELGYGLAGALVGTANTQPGADERVPYGAPILGLRPTGERFAGAGRSAIQSPCVRPQIITIGGGVRAAGRVRVVYGAPPCGA